MRTPETVNPTPETAENAFCTRWCLRYPELEGSLARRLAAAKKAKLAAATPKARGAAARRITLVARTQKQATARFAANCRVPA